MADMAVFELGDEPASVKIPDLNGLVVTCANESAADWVERESTNEKIVAGEGSNTFPTGGRPDFNLAVVRAGDD